MSHKPVHIRISDTGWILERLAHEISTRLPYVSYDTYPNGDAELQYYMTYGCRQQRVSPVEAALFTHKEDVPSAAQQFERVASEVDFCIAQSRATESILRADGVTNVQTISPGVDLAFFTPKVKIGVVGRTYHTGRKGESIVAQVMDVPGIEWHFTGPGWPGPPRFVADDDLPDFYRSLDYVLVPSLIEGGPMCVLEALACGCKVIGSPVGWVPEFPHIGFKLGDAADLRRVLLEVVEEKAKLRRSVEAYSWDAWAQQHDQLFCRLLGRDLSASFKQRDSLGVQQDTVETGALRAVVAVHGSEMSTSLGGPSVRAPRTVAALRRLGVDARFTNKQDFSGQDADLAHVFNVWHPSDCERLLWQAEKQSLPAVVSPIFLDLSERPWFDGAIRTLLKDSRTAEELDAGLSRVREAMAAHRALPMRKREPIPGYFSAVRRICASAHHVIALSEHERSLLEEIGVQPASLSIVKNPVDSGLFSNGDPSLFEEKFGVKDYVLCVGRIEPRKNQALLAYALRDLEAPLVLVGHEPSAEYAALVRKWAGTNVVFAGRLDPASPLMASALAGARVFCLPSWSEGAPLAALEAAAAGCNMVLSDRSSEREYFGDLARYVDPGDPASMASAVKEAFESGLSAEARAELQALVREEHGWALYAERTREAYRRAIEVCKTESAVRVPSHGRVFIDLTTTANHQGPSTGIARVEDRLAHELRKQGDGSMRFVIWNTHFQRFIEVFPDDIETLEVRNLRGKEGVIRMSNLPDQTPHAEVDFKPGDRLVVFGSGWMRNPNYCEDLWRVKAACEMTLVTTIYDTVQHKHRSLYPKTAVDEFSVNCKRLLEISDLVLTCSKRSALDISEFCAEFKVATPVVMPFRLGDEVGSGDPDAVLQEAQIAGLENSPFVLYVSSVDVRKNHRLLIELWRRLVSDHGDRTPRLVLVGRVGWRGEEAIALLESEPLLRRHVLLLHGINDPTLDWLYRNCLFTVYPSLYEGWGLPVAESLRYGKFCIASDGGSLPEVAPDCVEYINPLDFAAWLRALERYCFSKAAIEAKMPAVRGYRTTDWSDVALEVRGLIDRAHPVTRLPSATIGDSIDFTTDGSNGDLRAQLFKMGGWAGNEKAGSWTVGRSAVLGLDLERGDASDTVLRFYCRGFAPSGGPVNVVANCNGMTVGRWEVGNSFGFCYVALPAEVFQSGQRLIIELAVANPRSPAMAGGSKDQRMLGIMVQRMSVLRARPIVADDWAVCAAEDASEPLLFHCETTRQPSGCFVLEVESDKPSAVNVSLNGEGVVTDRAVQAGTSYLILSEVHGLNVIGRRQPFELGLTSAPGASTRVRRVGMFAQAPAIALESLRLRNARAVRPALAASDARHVPFAGLAPPLPLQSWQSIFASSDFVDGLAGGWQLPEPDGVWSTGTLSSLWLQPSPTTSDRLAISVCFTVFEPLLRAGGQVELIVGLAPPVVIADGSLQASQPFHKAQRVIELDRAQALDAQGRLAISLTTNGGLTPLEVGDAPDPRLISVKLHEVCVAAAEPSLAYACPPTEPSLIDSPQLSTMPADPSIRVDGHIVGLSTDGAGWHGPESDGRWSDGSPSILRLVVKPSAESSDVILEVEPFGPLLTEGGLRIEASTAGVPIGNILIKRRGPVFWRLPLPIHKTDEHRTISLTLDCVRSGRPSEWTDSLDARSLSFKIKSVSIENRKIHFLRSLTLKK